MLSRQREIRMQVHQLIDAGLFAIGYWLAHFVRFHVPQDWGLVAIPPFHDYIWMWLVIIPFAPMLLEYQGFYQRTGAPFDRRSAVQVGSACILAVMGVTLVMFMLKIHDRSRTVILMFGVFSYLLLAAKTIFLTQWRHSRLGQAQSKRRFVLVGTEEDSERLVAKLHQESHEEFSLVAQLNLNETPVETLADLLHEHSANGVILSAKHTFFGQVEKAVQLCELEGVETWLLADFFKTQISRISVDDFYGRPTLVFRSAPDASWQGLAKHLIDLSGALMLLLVAAIPMLVAAIAIRLTSKGPVLFRQERSGLNGEPFVMLKFRTMVSDAEQRKDELAAFNEMDGPVFKIADDPRITPLGRFLRKWSIDELPQLWNVLRGEMSLVGPRPLPVDETRRFHDLAHRRRLSVRPGLTCLWQVSGRNEVRDFKDWVRLDLEYIDNWSLWLDLKILLRTIPAVLAGTGAR